MMTGYLILSVGESFYSDEAAGSTGSAGATGSTGSDEAAGAASSPLEGGVGALCASTSYWVTKYPSGFVRSHCLINGSALSAVGTLRVCFTNTPLSHGEDSVFTRSPGVSHVMVSVAPAMTPRTRSNVEAHKAVPHKAVPQGLRALWGLRAL